ncbi:hypothetical protein CBW65_04385 [Tumebacillus avium]|uniref:Nucleoside diphosphate kinase-like domain-containing protein n=1 Tax=Tumebacillus avium TaxID=1903704 RepID=A0A1Y0IIU6_9BACL|nr:nucleoside-diphosphate kinase [Tumebacillus avium]ARU60388.1 hypothetical protein CBW65_04385 [Tumebacillus avium]
MVEIEYTVAVIKPDGMELQVELQFESLLEKYGLTVCSSKQSRLSQRDVEAVFAKNSPQYFMYMTSGPVNAYLLRGFRASEALYFLKQEIRAAYACEERGIMKNLIHSCDVGNEFAMQSRFFFPEDEFEYCMGIADLYVKLTEESIKQKKIEMRTLQERGNLRWAYCVMAKEKAPALWPLIAKDSGGGLTVLPALEMEFDWQGSAYPLLVYFPDGQISAGLVAEQSRDPQVLLKAAHTDAGLCALGYTPWREETAPLLRELKRCGLDGVVAFDAARSLQELDQLIRVADDELRLPLIGGSRNGHIGSITIGNAEYTEFLERCK